MKKLVRKSARGCFVRLELRGRRSAFARSGTGFVMGNVKFSQGWSYVIGVALSQQSHAQMSWQAALSQGQVQISWQND